MKIELKRGLLTITGAPDPQSDVAFAKRMWNTVSSAASYHQAWKKWRVPLSRDAVAGLRDMGVKMTPELEAWEREQDELETRRARANAMIRRDVADVRAWLERNGVRFKVEPFDHQVHSVAYGLILPACGLFLDTGCGKTYVAGTIMETLANVRGLNRFIVIAPKTILNVGWGEDLSKFTDLRWVNISDPPRRDPCTKCPKCGKRFKKHVTWSHLRTHLKPQFIAEHGEDGAKERVYARYPDTRPLGADSKRERLLRALASDAQVFLINPESFKLVIDDLIDQDWDMVIVDESSMLKSPRAQITGTMIEFGASVKRRVCMTATPRPNSSLEFWGQMAFIDQCLGGSFYAFRDKYYYQGYDGYSWNPKSRDVDMQIRDIVFERSLRYRLDDCVDLPGETYQDIEVELTPELRRHYDDMRDRMLVELEEGDIVETSWAIVQANKLSQITSGFIFDDDGNARFIADSPKISTSVELAKRLIDSEDRSVVIWARYQEEARMLEDELRRYGVSTMHGGTRDHEASARAFKSGKNRVMIAHALSAKFGHTWVEHCNAAIFHSYDHSFENFYQAKRRIYRIGQKRPVTYFPIIAKGTVDEHIISSVMKKQDSSEVVVDLRQILL